MSSVLTNPPETTGNPLSMKRPVEKVTKPTRPTDEPTKPRGRRWLLLITLIVAAGAGAAWYLETQLGAGQKSQVVSDMPGSENGSHEGKATLGFLPSRAPRNAAGRPIQTIPVEVLQQNDTLRLTGSLIADERSSVASNTSGIAAEVFVDRGSVVRKNDVLVQIDPTDAKNKLAEGQAMLDELKARLGLDGDMQHFDPEDQPEVRLAKAAADLTASNLRRAKELVTKKVISDEAYDQTQTEHELATQRYRQAKLLIKQAYQACKTAMAKLAILEKDVADTTIRAPFDGWVAEKLVSVGEQISSGMQATKVITLVRIDPLRLSLTVPQQDIGRIKPSQTVRFRVDSFPDRTFNATVQFIAPVVTNDTRSMIVEAVVPNSDGALRPGLFVTAELELKKQESEFLAPVGAVQRVGEVARVFVVRDGVVREHIIALGQQKDGKVEILSGLTGDEILVANPEHTHDGDAVRP